MFLALGGLGSSFFFPGGFGIHAMGRGKFGGLGVGFGVEAGFGLGFERLGSGCSYDPADVFKQIREGLTALGARHEGPG